MADNLIGIIGHGSQSKRIIKYLSKEKIIIYKKNKFKATDKLYTNNQKDLLKCNIIFILSPNNTHYYFLEKFNKNKYIFCEKPPVNKYKELLKLSKKNLNRIYFNFNYRYSKINEALKKTKHYKFGEILYGNISFGHGLATKKEYKNSWRATKNKNGVYDVLGIHLIDLINNNFKIKNIENRLSNFLKFGPPDNSIMNIKLKNYAEINCFMSYSSPYIQNFQFIYENGILEINDRSIVFRGPRNTFDKRGYFSVPKIKYKEKYNQLKDYNNSLKKSVSYFMSVVKNKKNFRLKENKMSILSNMYLLNSLK